MPGYSQMELNGIRWIENEFQRIAHELKIEYRHKGWDDFVFYVECVGDERRRGVEFSHAEVQDCAHEVDVETRRFVSYLLRRMLKHAEPTITKLYARMTLTGLESFE
jgi:hypothetical protein